MSKFLNKANNIKKFSSILLLLVLILAITPKKTLHDWFANHTDSTSTVPDGKTQQLSKSGFTCLCDNLVAESHFITPVDLAVINISSVHLFVIELTPSFFSLAHFHTNLRGPPLKFDC